MSVQDELPELDAEELALLAAFAQDDRPAPAARERVKARILETTVPTAAAPPQTGSVLRGPWVPWVAGSVLAAAAAALLVVTMGGNSVTAERDPGLLQAPDTPESAHSLEARQEPQPAPNRGQRSADTAPPLPPPLPEQAPTGVVPTGAPPPATAEAPVPRTPRRSPSTQRKSPDAQTPAATSPSSLAEETRLLERAREAVTGNRPKDALALLRDAEAKFPNGVLRQERAVLRVVALCDAGKAPQGRTAAAAFLRAHPRSALRSRVESACPEATP